MVSVQEIIITIFRAKKKANFAETKQVIANVAQDRAKQAKTDVQVKINFAKAVESF